MALRQAIEGSRRVPLAGATRVGPGAAGAAIRLRVPVESTASFHPGQVEDTMERLFSPWRLRYVASEKRAASGCVRGRGECAIGEIKVCGQ